MRKKIIRISTVPISLNVFLKGQLNMLSEHYEIVAVSSPSPDLTLVGRREEVRVVAVPMERHPSIFKDLISLFRLIKLFAKEKPDVVHSMTPKAGLLAMLAAYITRVPVRMHTFTGLVFPSRQGILRKILMGMDSLTCFCATYINPEGEGVKKDLERFHITSKPLHVIANGNVRGIDLDYYDRSPEVMEKVKELRDESKTSFCFVGRLVKDKGINELISAFTKLSLEYPNIRLLLVGPYESELDPLLPETLDLIEKHSDIYSVGLQKDIRPYLAASDIFVFPSYREGFPNVVLEAGAMGLPAIVTDINGCNEIIIPGRNGEIIPKQNEKSLYETMKDWLENPHKVKDMANHARQLVAERYEQKMIWNALLEEYKRLLKK